MDQRSSLAELWPPSGACALCETEGPLCRSHIIPKFVGDWLRQTGVTGRLRSSKVPDRLVQDLEWRYLLCADCEGRFNRFETEVCERIFLPLHDRQQDRFRYGPAFSSFAVAAVWRVLVLMRREGRVNAFDQAPGSIDAAESTWRAFLLRERRTPAPHVVHAFPMDVPVDLDTSELSPYWARFVLRTPGWGARYHNGAGYLIVKMARLFIIGVVVAGPERHEWRNTQLHASGGAWGVDRWHVPGWFYWHLNNGARRLQESVERLSEKQRQVTQDKLWEFLQVDPDAVAQSDVFKAFETDLSLFGDVVFDRDDDKEP